MDVTLLQSAQTFLGVIATLAILCLFSSHKEGNFISLLLGDIDNNTDINISKYANNIKEKVNNRKNKLYEENDLKFDDESPESYLNSRVLNQKKFASIIAEMGILTNKALETSENIKILNKDRKEQVKNDYSKRHETKLVALLVLLTSLFFLIMDILNICLEYAVPFTYFFISYLLVFSLVMWKNYFSNHQNQKIQDEKKKRVLSVLIRLCFIFSPLLLLILLFLQIPRYATMIAIIVYLVAVVVFAIRMFSRYRYFHNYPVAIVLRHFFYFICASILGTVLLVYLRGIGNETFLINSSWLYSPFYARILLVTILIADIVFIPLFGGYLYLRKGEIKIKRKYRKSEKSIDKELDAIIEKLHLIICEVKMKE